MFFSLKYVNIYNHRGVNLWKTKEKRTSLIKQYKYAKRHNDYSEMVIITVALFDRTTEQEILFGQYLIANGKIEETRATFGSTNGGKMIILDYLNFLRLPLGKKLGIS